MALGIKHKSRSQLRLFNRGVYVVGILSGFVLLIYFYTFFKVSAPIDSEAATEIQDDRTIQGVDIDNIITYYNFDRYPVLKATEGISASKISKYSNIKKGATNNTAGLSAGSESKAINMVFDIHPKFNSAGILMHCSFKQLENTGILFKRGNNFELSFNGNDLRVKYSLFQSEKKSIKVNEKIGNVLNRDGEFTDIRFLYEPTLGLAIVQINGKNVWKKRSQQNLAMNWESTKPIIFASNVNGAGNEDAIFDELIIASTTPPVELPFELLSFVSQAEENTIILDWYTYKESETDYFIIEKSRDGKKFEEVGRTKAAGHSDELMNYTLTDQFPTDGITFYRLHPSNSDIPPSLLPVTAIEYQLSKQEAKR